MYLQDATHEPSTCIGLSGMPLFGPPIHYHTPDTSHPLSDMSLGNYPNYTLHDPWSPSNPSSECTLDGPTNLYACANFPKLGTTILSKTTINKYAVTY